MIANSVRMTLTWGLLVLLLSTALGGTLVPGKLHAQDGVGFTDLDPNQPVIDQTGSSLTPEQIGDLESQVAALTDTGAEVVLLVRYLNATPEETLDQVEALQQAWVAETGSNQDVTIAVLINRNPDDPRDARAGIYVGRTYNDGNIPEDEQVSIVEDVLIPPLRNSDVHASFSNTLARIQDDILYGPPQSSFERWAEGARAWIPWASAALAALAAIACMLLFQRRQTIQHDPLPPSTMRPEQLIPAVAGALVAGGAPQASAFPATVLDPATRGALRIEPESEGGTFSRPKIKVRLLDERLLSAAEERIVWDALQRRAELGVVSSKNLPRAASDDSSLKQRVSATMRERDWLDSHAGKPRTGLFVIGLLALAAALGTFIVTTAAGGGQGFIGVGLLVVAGILAFGLYGNYSGLSRTGQMAALRWRAYRDGLKQAAKSNTLPINFDDVLADAVAFNLGSAVDGRMKSAVEEGTTFRAFSASTAGGASFPAIFPWWVAYTSSMSTASGSSAGSTVSGGGAGGGGGAAGST
jgi:uncharacterized membrane protein YgcG